MDRQGKRRVQLSCNKGYYFPELRQEIDLVHLMLISQNATFYFYEKRKRKTEYKNNVNVAFSVFCYSRARPCQPYSPGHIIKYNQL